jgi:hypothetical protein
MVFSTDRPLSRDVPYSRMPVRLRYSAVEVWAGSTRLSAGLLLSFVSWMS